MKFSEFFFKEIGDSPQFLQKGGDARGGIIKSKIRKEKIKKES